MAWGAGEIDLRNRLGKEGQLVDFACWMHCPYITNAIASAVWTAGAAWMWQGCDNDNPLPIVRVSCFYMSDRLPTNPSKVPHTKESPPRAPPLPQIQAFFQSVGDRAGDQRGGSRGGQSHPGWCQKHLSGVPES